MSRLLFRAWAEVSAQNRGLNVFSTNLLGVFFQLFQSVQIGLFYGGKGLDLILTIFFFRFFHGLLVTHRTGIYKTSADAG